MLSRSLSLILIISLFFASCTSESGRLLRDADAVMEEYPDSAMYILEGIDSHTLKGNEIPYYALLYTQAQVKTDVPIDSDSLVIIAYKKYGNRTRGDLGIRSNFYTGEIFFNQEKYREAMKYYLTAYEESKRLNNDYWHAKAAERISDLFFFAYNYDEAEKYALEAANLFKMVGRQTFHRYTIGKLANIYVNNGDAERAYILLDSLNKVTLNDSMLLSYIEKPLIDAAIRTGREELLISKELDISGKDLSNGEIIDKAILKSRVCNLLDNADEAKDMLNAVEGFANTDEERIHILYARYENAKADDDLYLAISLIDSMLYYQNKVAEEIIQESVTGAQRDFYSEKSILQENKSKFFRFLLVVVVSVLLLVIVFIIIIFRFRYKVQQAELKANMESFLSLKIYSDKILREKETLQQLLNEKDTQMNLTASQLQAMKIEKDQQEMGYSDIIEKLFKEKWVTLDSLCDQYFGLNNSELTSKALVLNIEKELKKIVSKKGLVEIVDSVDTYMGGIITNLGRQCQFLKKEDINFLALIYAGFSVRAVCMFTGIKYSHFYVKKSRLVKRIQNSDAPDKSHFLEKLK